MRRAAFAAFVLAVAAVPCTAAPNFVLRSGPHFRVLCHFDDERAADAALETVEAIWPTVSALYGVPESSENGLYDVHLFRTPADYVRAEREISGKFDRNMAFTSFDTKAAYVAVQPEVTDETLAATGLTAQTRRMLVHEAAHVVRYRNSPGYRRQPGWFADGNAQWVEDEVMTSRGWAPPPEEDPHVSQLMILAKTLLASGALPSARQVLMDDVQGLEFYARYAVRRLLFRRLVTRKDAARFRDAVTKALSLPDGPDLAKRFTDLVLTVYEAEGLDGLDLDFEQYVRSLAPAWEEPAAGRTLSTAGDAWLQTAFADSIAYAWRTAPVGFDSYEVTGRIEILPGLGQHQQMNVLLAREPRKGFVSVAFGARDGVAVWRHVVDGDHWEKLASTPARAVQLWRRRPFRVSIDRGKVTVCVDGGEVLSVDVEDADFAAPWGLGVQQGGAGIWRDVRVTPARR